MSIESDTIEERQRRLQERGFAVPDRLQGVTSERVGQVLESLGLGGSADCASVVFALLDDETPSWFSNAPKGARFSDGATIAQIGAHVGILQRGGVRKLDREGRDYWIKPLRELGIVEAILLKDGEFLDGHIVAKSPNSAYRLSADFLRILRLDDSVWPIALTEWAQQDAQRERARLRSEAEMLVRSIHASPHVVLIRASVELYAATFLPDYEVIYVDDSDGDRMPENFREKLSVAGLSIRIDDAYPDVLLWSKATDSLWAIEAVTSDGEVDSSKVERMTRFAHRHGKRAINFTTTYLNWRTLAARQSANFNVAVNTYVWIVEDPGRALLVTSFKPPTSIEAVPLPHQVPLD